MMWGVVNILLLLYIYLDRNRFIVRSLRINFSCYEMNGNEVFTNRFPVNGYRMWVATETTENSNNIIIANRNIIDE